MYLLDDSLIGRPGGATLARAPGLRLPVAAVVLALHIGGLIALDLLDSMQPPQDAGGAVEIPVEVLADAPPDKAEKQAPEGVPPPQPQQQQSQQLPPQAANAAQPGGKAANQQRGLVLERPRENSLPQKAGARGAPDDARKPESAADQKESKPEEQPFGALAPLDKAAETPQNPTFLSPQALMQPRRTQAETSSGNDNYRARVLQKVQDAMLDPGRPRPKAVALVSFTVDDAGALGEISLARPSGHADLDAEALDMVRRAAPFPPPPANASRTFGAFIEFGE